MIDKREKKNMFALKEQKCFCIMYVSIQIKNVLGSTYNEKQMP